eukprot:9722933-Alexandrium_andersonii.AAC.1
MCCVSYSAACRARAPQPFPGSLALPSGGGLRWRARASFSMSGPRWCDLNDSSLSTESSEEPAGRTVEEPAGRSTRVRFGRVE